MRIGQRVLNLLEEYGRTQSELAKYLGIGTSTVNGWRQENRNPSSELIIPICEFFNITTKCLLTGRANDLENNIENEENVEVGERIIEFDVVRAGLRAYLLGRYIEMINFDECVVWKKKGKKCLSEGTKILENRLEKFAELCTKSIDKDSINKDDFPTSDEWESMQFFNECKDEAAIELGKRLNKEHEIIVKKAERVHAFSVLKNVELK